MTDHGDLWRPASGPPPPGYPGGPSWGPPPLGPPPPRRNYLWLYVLAGVSALLLVASIILVTVVISRRGDAEAQPTVPAPVSPPAASTPAESLCNYVPSQGGLVPRKVTPPRVDSVATTGQATARLRTNLGLLTLTLDRVAAPCTVNNFLELARQGYYDGTDCHRLVTRQLYVLQCGDPGGTGTGGPGYTFPDENLPSDTTTPVTFPAGTIAMANAGPDTNGSQFFIVYQEFQLPPTYTIFGKLTTGMAVVEGVAAVGSDPSEDGRPKKPISIKSINLSD